jgi:hypothetical protein
MPAPKKVARVLEGGGRGSQSTGGAGRSGRAVKPKLTSEQKKANKELVKKLRKTNKANEKKALAPKPKVTIRPDAADQSFRRDEMMALRAAHLRATQKRAK